MPTMKDLREAGMTSALAPLGARIAALKQGATETLEVEELTLKVAAIAGTRLDMVATEVDRRAEAFNQAQASSPHVLGNPRKRALQSVLDDLMTGRLA